MIKFRTIAATALLGTSALMLAAAPASAAGCRDAKGHYAKCPASATVSKTSVSKTARTARTAKMAKTAKVAKASTPTTAANAKAHPTG